MPRLVVEDRHLQRPCEATWAVVIFCLQALPTGVMGSRKWPLPCAALAVGEDLRGDSIGTGVPHMAAPDLGTQ